MPGKKYTLYGEMKTLNHDLIKDKFKVVIECNIFENQNVFLQDLSELAENSVICNLESNQQEIFDDRTGPKSQADAFEDEEETQEEGVTP